MDYDDIDTRLANPVNPIEHGCSYCHAKSGEPCRTKRGVRMTTYHADRHRSARGIPKHESVFPYRLNSVKARWCRTCGVPRSSNRALDAHRKLHHEVLNE